MAKQPWQESKKKTTGDINREIKRAEVRREEKAKGKIVAEKTKKAKRLGVLTLLLAGLMYFMSTDMGTTAEADKTLFYLIAAFMVAFSGFSWINYGRYQEESPMMWYILGGALAAIGAVLCIIILL